MRYPLAYLVQDIRSVDDPVRIRYFVKRWLRESRRIETECVLEDIKCKQR